MSKIMDEAIEKVTNDNIITENTTLYLGDCLQELTKVPDVVDLACDCL